MIPRVNVLGKETGVMTRNVELSFKQDDRNTRKCE